MNAKKSDLPKQSGLSRAVSGTRQEVRCAVRFPLALPRRSPCQGRAECPHPKCLRRRRLFALDRELKVGPDIHFSLRMPGSVLGTPQDVLVHCRGRVVRCSISQSHYQAAATIDEYHFVEP